LITAARALYGPIDLDAPTLDRLDLAATAVLIVVALVLIVVPVA
jgi:hypothetical protein